LSTLTRAVFSRATSKIDLTFDNKVVVTFPSSKLSFLKGQEQHNIEEIIIQEKGTVLYWPNLDKKYTVTEVLKQLLGE
jgi:hypothetical protein